MTSLLSWIGMVKQAASPPLVAPEPDIEAELQPFDGPLDRLPATRAEVYRLFGNPGVGKVDPTWERAHLVVARGLPGRWNRGAGKLYVHRLAEPYLREALRRCQLLDCLDELESIGCFNFRHQRHDPARPLSYHSWAIAVDINSTDNGGWYVRQPPARW